MKLRKRWKRLLCALGIGALFSIWLLAVYRLGTWTYSSLDAYKKAGGEMPFSIPENADECRFAIRKTGLGKIDLYAFTLDVQGYDTYIKDIVQKYNLEGKAETAEEKEDEKYGYRAWYGKKAADCRDPEYSLDDFPFELPFSEITDGSIEDYTVIIYNPRGSSAHSYAMVTDETTRRVAVYSAHFIK